MIENAYTRRGVLWLAGAGALTGLVAACAPAPTTATSNSVAPTPPPTSPPATLSSAPTAVAFAPTSAPTPEPRAGSVLPNYIPSSARSKPDYPSKGELYEDGYIRYPSPAVNGAPLEPSGSGRTVTALVDALYPPPTPLEQNPAWQEINKRLNANVQFNIVPPADYPTKLATVMAGNDYPDIINLFGGLSAGPNVPAFLQQAAADLTPHLAGEAVKDYPNLAALPTFAWRNLGGVINGRLWMIPITRPSVGSLMVKNSTVWDHDVGQDAPGDQRHTHQRLRESRIQRSGGVRARSGCSRRVLSRLTDDVQCPSCNDEPCQW